MITQVIMYSTVIMRYTFAMMTNTLIPKHPSAHRAIEFSQEDYDNIVAAFKKTLVLTTVAGLCKRHRQTIDRWLKHGEADLLDNKDTPFSQLYIKVKEAVAYRILELEERLLRDPEGWQRIAWVLERTVRRDYSVYGEIWDDFERKLQELIVKQMERDQPKAREISNDMRQWIKATLAEGNQKHLESKAHGREMDSKGDQEEGRIAEGIGREEGRENPREET